MPIIVNGTEIERVVCRAPGVVSELDQVDANGVTVFVSTVPVAKPTISGAFTFDTQPHSPTVAGYDPDAMTQSGTASATAAGTYTLTYTLKKGYAWPDGTRDPVSLTWTIARRVLAIPSLTGTSQAFIEGVTRAPSVSGFDAAYETQGGTASSALMGTYDIIWSLRYPASTTWSDDTTEDKRGSWTNAWVNGTSHYIADVFNAGWGSGNVALTSSQSGGSVGAVIHVSSQQQGYPCVYTAGTYTAGKTCHAIVRALAYSVNGYNCAGRDYPSFTYKTGTSSTGWTEISWEMTEPDVTYDRAHFGFGSSQTGGFEIQRIWVT